MIVALRLPERGLWHAAPGHEPAEEGGEGVEAAGHVGPFGSDGTLEGMGAVGRWAGAAGCLV